MSLVLNTTAKSLKIAMTGAAATTNPDFESTWADNDGTTFTEGSLDGVLNGTSDVTVVAAPSGSNRRVVKSVRVFNRDTAAVTLIVKYDSGTQRQIFKPTLAVGDTWTLHGTFDANGNLKSAAGGITTVANGGSGRNTNTAYAVICGGTSDGGVEQSIASVGTAGQVLTSNGAGALPTYQAAAGAAVVYDDQTYWMGV